MSENAPDLTEWLDLNGPSGSLDAVDTPCPVIDIDVAAANLLRWQLHCDRFGIASRPHIKTHKLAGLARAQIDLGAIGVTVQKLGEAQVMAAAGIRDILLTFNIIGRAKLERLGALAPETDIKVVADNAEMLPGLAFAASLAGRDIGVLVECDTGAGRNGVQTPLAAADLATSIDRMPGLVYAGLATYPKPGMRVAVAEWLAEARALAAKAGLETGIVSSGGTPDMWSTQGLDALSEYRVGTYVYFDRSQVARGACQWSDCALGVHATVVSRPTPARAMLDCGSKALTSDLLGMTGYGVATDLGNAVVTDLSEEHGFLNVSGADPAPRVGDRVRIVPNHVCPVVNLFDEVAFTRAGALLGMARVDARGMVR